VKAAQESLVLHSKSWAFLQWIFTLIFSKGIFHLCIHIAGQAEIKSAESFTRRSMAFVIHQISSSQLPSKTEG